MAYGGLSFPDTGCPVPDVYIYYVSDMINACDTVSKFINPPRMFLSTDILFKQRIGWYTMSLLYIRQI